VFRLWVAEKKHLATLFEHKGKLMLEFVADLKCYLIVSSASSFLARFHWAVRNSRVLVHSSLLWSTQEVQRYWNLWQKWWTSNCVKFFIKNR